MATASREAYAATLMREALGSAPDPDAVLVHFAESVSPEEAELLRHIPNEHESDAHEDGSR